MKRKIFFGLLIACLIYSFTTGLVLRAPNRGNVPGVGGNGDICDSGALITSWHMEDVDLANEDGCSVIGDSVWAANNSVELTSGDKSEGTYSAYGNAGAEYYFLNPTQNQALSEGTIWIDVRMGGNTEFHAWLYMFDSGGEDHIIIRVFLDGSKIDITGKYRNGASQTVIANTNIYYTDNKWWRLKYQYKVGAAGGDHQISAWELDNSSPRQTTGSEITAGAADILSTALSDITEIRVGRAIDQGDDTWVDNFKWYATSEL
jgi:hypothetical protein